MFARTRREIFGFEQSRHFQREQARKTRQGKNGIGEDNCRKKRRQAELQAEKQMWVDELLHAACCKREAECPTTDRSTGERMDDASGWLSE